MVQIKLVPS